MFLSKWNLEEYMHVDIEEKEGTEKKSSWFTEPHWKHSTQDQEKSNIDLSFNTIANALILNIGEVTETQTHI